MKLTYLVQYYPPEKSAGLDLVEDLLEGFANHGWNINLYVPTPTRGVTKEQRVEYSKKRIEKKYDDKLTIHRMRLYQEGKVFASRAIRYVLFSIECFWKAVTVPADFIFTGSGPPSQGVCVGLAKRLSRKKKVVYNLQDIFPDSLITSEICNKDSVLFKIGRKMEDFTYRNVDLIITITDDMKRNVVEKGVNPDKVKVIRNWIDTDRVVPVARENNKLFDELHLPRNKFYVVYAGNLGKVQGVEVIVETAKLLANNDGIQFLIFGGGSEEEKIKAMAKNLPNVCVFPLMPQDRVSEVYSMANVSVVSCKPGTGGSGMPSKTWTIMSTGTPIIASFDLRGEMDRIIKEARCGYTIEPGKAEKLRDVVLQLKNDKELVRVMAENARQFAVSNVNKEKAVEQYIETIENVLLNGE